MIVPISLVRLVFVVGLPRVLVVVPMAVVVDVELEEQTEQFDVDFQPGVVATGVETPQEIEAIALA